MKNSLDLRMSNLFLAITRFPISILCIIGIYLYSNLVLFDLIIYDKGVAEKLLPILLSGFPLFIIAQLYSESKKQNKFYSYLFSIPLYIIIVTYIIHQNDYYAEISCLIVALYISILIAPFLSTKNGENNHIYIFIYHFLKKHFVFSVALLILFIGFVLITLSFSFLFDLKISSKFYYSIFFFIFLFIYPISLLISLPKQVICNQRIEHSKAEKNILAYIILPLFMIYTVTIYLYGAKILLFWELPKGGIVILTSIFGLIGIAIYLSISYFVKNEDNNPSIISFFYRYFFVLFFIPVILLAIAVSVRITEYGITEERYLALLILLWFLSIMIFHFLGKKIYEIKFIFTSIIILLIVSLFGPWSISNLSLFSQVSRLKHLLEKNELLVNDKFIENGKFITDNKDCVQISSIMRYLEKSDKRAYVEKSLNTELINVEKKMSCNLGNRQSIANNKNNEQKIYFSIPFSNKDQIKISGYDYFFDIVVNDYSTTFDEKKKLSVKLENQNYIIRFNDNTKEQIVINLEELLDNSSIYINLTEFSSPNKNLDNNEMHQEIVINKEISEYNVKVIIYNIRGYSVIKDTIPIPTFNNVNSYILVKKK